METSELPVSQQLIGTNYPELNLDYKKPTFMEPTTKRGPRTPLEFKILLQTYSECDNIIRRTSDIAVVGKKRTEFKSSLIT